MLDVNLTKRKNSEDLREYILKQQIQTIENISFTNKMENLSLDPAKAQNTSTLSKLMLRFI